MRTTYHDGSGRFCPAHSARLVVKAGDRYKVVRQHRRIGGKKHEAVGLVVDRSKTIHAKASLLSTLIGGSGWISVEAISGRRGER